MIQPTNQPTNHPTKKHLQILEDMTGLYKLET